MRLYSCTPFRTDSLCCPAIKNAHPRPAASRRPCVDAYAFVTHLRQKMLDELQRRNYSQNTVYTYLHAVEDFSRYFHRSPDRLGPDHIRQYQAYLFRERKLQAGTIASFATPQRCSVDSS